ncbi:MAG: hypothetical protein ACT4QC_03490 [Planctomycetaceae bacterium]
MRRCLLALSACCLLMSGCCSCGSFGNCCTWCDWCKFGQAEDDGQCGCCTDGSESPRYKPPGPWWTRPDCGCPKHCQAYQDARRSVVEEARVLQLQSATQVGVHQRCVPDYGR